MRLRKEAYRNVSNNNSAVPTLMTAQELADLWRVLRRSIYNSVSAGTIAVKPIRIGNRGLRWRTKDVEAYIARQ